MINLHGISVRRPPRMDTRKYHAEMEARKKETTEALKREVRERKKLQKAKRKKK